VIWLLLACDATDSGEDSSVVPLDPRVSLGDVQACEAPAASVTYTESGSAWGLLDGMVEEERHEESPSLAVADVDGDGRDDLLVHQQLGTSVFYTHGGDRFVPDERTILGPGTSALFFDVDGDGQLEVIVGGLVPSVLRAGSGPATPIVGIPAIDERAPLLVHDLAPGDLDGNGVTDLYAVLTRDQHDGADYDDVVIRTDGGALDVLVDAVPWDVGIRHGFDATWFDEDGDGDLDVYVANDLGSVMGESTLLRNDGGTLADASDDCFCALKTNNKGVDVGDVNRDGLPDLYVTGNPHNTLLSQLDDGTWVDVTSVTNAGGVDEGVTGWGGNLVDFDNDGWLDLLSAQGDRWNTGNENERIDVAPRLLRQVDGRFEDVGADVGVTGSGSFRAAVSIDFNADGVEDLLVTGLSGPPLLFLSDGCTAAGWLEVTAPRGSRVEVVTEDGVQAAWVRGDEGYLANGPPRVHFGLGDAADVSELRVTLPGGETLVTPAFAGRRRVTVVE
jgi:hypothetical protein